MKPRVHALCGISALILIALFFLSSVLVEVFGDHHEVAQVKTAIVFALCALVPAMAATGATGVRISRERAKAPLIRRKQRRMAVIAAIGLLVLVPSAFILHTLASDGNFGTAFALVEALELVGGAVNVTLMSLNVRDGRTLTRAKRRRRRQEKLTGLTAVDEGSESVPSATL
jgi:hypothetical protein